MRNRLDSRQASAEATAAAIAAAGSAEAPGGADTRPGNKLLWHAYAAPPDAIGWLDSVIGSVETMRICVAISDMRIAGNPLIYVNQAFCQVTGYTKAEVHGRNCRFLQGPETEISSVATIIECLRRGADCTVKLTNYKRSGETFDNVLAMRPVHDSNGVYRFCVGVQIDASAGRVEVDRVSAFVALLPMTLEVGSTPPCGPEHESGRRDKSRPPSYFQAAFISSISGNVESSMPQATDLRDVVRFSRHHTIADQQLGVFDPSKPFTRLLWFAEQSDIIETLVSMDHFRALFTEHMSDPRVGAPHQLLFSWRSLASAATTQSDGAATSKSTSDPFNASATTDKAKNKLLGLLGGGGRGGGGGRRRSMPQMKQDVAKLKAATLPQILSEGFFASFLQSPRALRFLEQMNSSKIEQQVL